MAILPILKSPLALGTMGVVGTGGVVLAGWYAIGRRNSDGHYSDEQPNDNLEVGSCASGFFPRKGETQTEEKKQKSEVPDTDATDEKVKVMPPSEFGSSNPVGCTSMLFDYNLDRKTWFFNAEVTVKNDKIAWVLLVKGGGIKEEEKDYGQSLVYTLHLFSINSSSIGWKKDVSYSWRDRGISGSKFNLNISRPSGNQWISVNEGAVKSKTQRAKRKYYSGIWTTSSGAKAKEVFGEIEVWGNDKNKVEILGRSKPFAGDSAAGYSSVDAVYLREKENWFSYLKNDGSQKENKSLGIGEILDKWYEPFKNKRGEWKDTKGYCSKKNGVDNEEVFREICS